MEPLLAAMQLPDNFWPTSAIGWMTLVGLVVGGGAAAWRFTKVVHDLNGLGQRVNEHDERAAALEARMNKTEQDAKFAELDRAGLREAIGRLSTQLETMVKLTQTGSADRTEKHLELIERLVRIETLVDPTLRAPKTPRRDG